MAIYNLSGAGSQGLTSGTTRLFIEIITFNNAGGAGVAFPTNYYHQGLVRLGNQGFWYHAEPIDAADMVLDVPSGVTTLGFSLESGVNIKVSEQLPPPAGGAAFVSTNLDGQQVSTGTQVVVSWGNITSPDPFDWITIKRAQDEDGTGNFSFLSPLGWFYTSTLDQTGGGTPSSGGQYTGTIVNPFGSESTQNAVFAQFYAAGGTTLTMQGGTINVNGT